MDKCSLEVVDCAEYSRDLLNFVLAYLPDARDDQRCPTNIPRLPDEEVRRRRARGFHHRTVIGVGHSVGACA